MMVVIVGLMRRFALCALLGAAALVGCGGSSGGSDGDTQVADVGDTLESDGGDVIESDADVPGPGECELNWVSGFTPFIGARPMTWDLLRPSEVGKVYASYSFVPGDGPEASFYIDIQSCRLEAGSFQLTANGEDNSVLYALSFEVPSFPGPGTWLMAATDGLDVALDLQDPDDHTLYYLAHSSNASRCEICVDSTGRQGAFRCDALVEDGAGGSGGIRFAGFICPDDEPGFNP